MISALFCRLYQGLGKLQKMQESSMGASLQRHLRRGAKHGTLLRLVVTSPWHTLAVALRQVLHVSDEEEKFDLMAIWEENKKAEYKSVGIAVSAYNAASPLVRKEN